MENSSKPSLRYIGNDISQATFDTAIPSTNTYQVYQFSNDVVGWSAFEKHLTSNDICVMEATGIYHVGLATYLFEKGYQVCVVNPLSVKYYSRMTMKRAKTDKADASLIAEFGKITQPSTWQPQEIHLTELQQLMAINEQFLKQKVALSNQFKNFKLAPNTKQSVLEILETQLSTIKEQIKEIEVRVKQIIQEHYQQMDEALQSIPGIGPKAAATLILITGGFTKFEKYKALIAYAGLAPRTYESGTSVKGHSHICKLGAKQLRKMLYVCAHSAKRFNPICKKLFDRLYHQNKKPFKVAMIAVANKLIKLAFTIAINGKTFDPNYHINFKTAK